MPVELDRIYASLRDLSERPRPQRGQQGRHPEPPARGDRDALDGKGALGNQMLINLAAAAKTFGDGSGDLFATVERARAVHPDPRPRTTGSCGSSSRDLAGVSAQLAGERVELQEAVASVARAVGTVQDLRQGQPRRAGRRRREADPGHLKTINVRAGEPRRRAPGSRPMAIGNLALAFNNRPPPIGSRIAHPGLHPRRRRIPLRGRAAVPTAARPARTSPAGSSRCWSRSSAGWRRGARSPVRCPGSGRRPPRRPTPAALRRPDQPAPTLGDAPREVAGERLTRPPGSLSVAALTLAARAVRLRVRRCLRPAAARRRRSTRRRLLHGHRRVRRRRSTSYPASPVMVDDVTVGEVTEVERVGWHAKVTMRVRDDVEAARQRGRRDPADQPAGREVRRPRAARPARARRAARRRRRHPAVRDRPQPGGRGGARRAVVPAQRRRRRPAGHHHPGAQQRDGRPHGPAAATCSARSRASSGRSTSRRPTSSPRWSRSNSLTATLNAEKKTIGDALDALGPAVEVLADQHDDADGDAPRARPARQGRQPGDRRPARTT